MHDRDRVDLAAEDENRYKTNLTKLMICVLVRRKHGAEIFIFSVKSLIFGYLKSQTFQLHCDSPHTDTL